MKVRDAIEQLQSLDPYADLVWIDDSQEFDSRMFDVLEIAPNSFVSGDGCTTIVADLTMRERV